MKSKRLLEISRIIYENEVTTQEELLDHLRAAGFDVTQATVSRDIKELRLSKQSGPDGRSRYALPVTSDATTLTDKFRTIFRESVIEAAVAGNLVVLRCYTGMGNAACAALDSMQFPHIVGTIAGDDTIFAAVETQQDASDLQKKLSVLL